MVDESIKGQTLTLASELGLQPKQVNLEHLRRIMSVRLEEIFQLIGQDLEQSGALDYVRAGALLCGGGARIAHISRLAEQVLQMPVSAGKTTSISGLKSALDQPEFATAIGLVKFGSFQQRRQGTKSCLSGGFCTSLSQIFRRNWPTVLAIDSLRS